MRDLTFGLKSIYQHLIRNQHFKMAYSSLSLKLAEKDPLCSSKVPNILSTGVEISNALSEEACARLRFRHTFSARIFACRVVETSSSITHSSSASTSSFTYSS